MERREEHAVLANFLQAHVQKRVEGQRQIVLLLLLHVSRYLRICPQPIQILQHEKKFLMFQKKKKNFINISTCNTRYRTLASMLGCLEVDTHLMTAC